MTVPSRPGHDGPGQGRDRAAPRSFDPFGALPEGTTVLEASAGTGKTYTIAAMAVRMVAEGTVDLSQLLLVTFGRAATQELRDRVRSRFAEVAVGLARGATDPPADPLVNVLADAPAAQLRARIDRLQRAVVNIDAATIVTTHGFCQQMLSELGLAGDMSRDVEFLEQTDDLVTEVTDDLYLGAFGAPRGPLPELTFAQARQAVSAAVADPHARLVVHRPDDDPGAYRRFSMADRGRQGVAGRMRQRRLMGYDDQLSLLRLALRRPDSGPAARRRLRERFRVVMVDEFQDTDPVQWDILRTAFHGHSDLVLIGDPKQAIYAFRGGDVVTYLAAAREARTRQTLSTNWRSDEPLVDGLQRIFRGAALGDEGIVVRPVSAHHRQPRLHDPRTSAAVRIRTGTREQGPSYRGLLTAAPARHLVAQDVADDVVATLTSGATLALSPQRAAVRPGDIAVLVRTNDQAALVRDTLAEVGVPAVIAGTRSVFVTAAAREWLVLLRALEQPHRGGLARSAALTCFLGWSAQDLAVATESDLEGLGERLSGWRDVLAARGVAALLEEVTVSAGLVERLLGGTDGERNLTDLRHVAEVLHIAASRERLGTAAVVEWLGRRVAEAAEDPSEERSRRLESDADAVQVVTVHSSKGLQFPVVYVPYGWDRYVGSDPDSLRLHAPDGTRLLDVGGREGEGFRRHLEQHREEEAGEDLRLLYVAMTRAQCQVVTWWMPATTARAAPLHRLLFGSFGPEEQPAGSTEVPTDGEVWRRLQDLASQSEGTIAVEPLSVKHGSRWDAQHRPPAGLSVASFRRRLDASWRRASYSGLTARAHAGPTQPLPGVGSEPEQAERDDEVDAPEIEDVGEPVPQEEAQQEEVQQEEAMRSIPSPLADLPAGPAFGTLVHEVLERLDPRQGDLPGELQARCSEAVRRRLASTVDPAALAAGLLPVLQTPLGPRAYGRRLADIDVADRLAELDFELPLAGGDRPHPGKATGATGATGAMGATVRDVASLLGEHLGADDPLAGYQADLVADPVTAGQRLRGYLTGSIDAVLRVRDEAGAPRYLVVDYKTNRLPAAGPLSAWDYRPSALGRAMRASHYPLQALLYSVALHRYLRWRQPDYDPGTHLGGVLYLFVRGMCGPDTPAVAEVPCGVFSWEPSADLVAALSQLLEGKGR